MNTERELMGGAGSGDIACDRWVSEQEAAKMLGTTAAVLRLSRSTGVIWKDIPAPPFIKLGVRKIVYSLLALIEFMRRYGR